MTEQYTKRFPFVDIERLCTRLKSRKKSDREYIFERERSEDYVTWNVLQALRRGESSSWWPKLAGLARLHSRDGDTSLAFRNPPVIDVWRKVASPPDYEAASRRRMEESDNHEWRERAANPRAVEGPTEVDAVLESDEYLIFVEAKLHSPVDQRTTYDPKRNQIVRNIDCVIEEARDRRPYFWMFVRDRDRHSELIDRYRSDLKALASELPHRDPVDLEQVAGSIAVIEWRELVMLLPATRDLKDVLVELHRRVA